MESQKSLKHLLFIDIETVSSKSSFEELDEKFQLLWEKKANYLNNELLPSDLFFDKAGLYAEFGKIIVIGLGMIFTNEEKEICLKTIALVADSEPELLKKFKEIILKTDQDNLKFVAHNGKEFDFPYISRRMLINGINLPDVLDISYKKPWEIQHLDTMAMWKFGDWKSYTSLDLLAAVLGIDHASDEMDGSKVNTTYYNENNIQKIADYCIEDVITTVRIYLKLNGFTDLKPENIVREG